MLNVSNFLLQQNALARINVLFFKWQPIQIDCKFSKFDSSKSGKVKLITNCNYQNLTAHARYYLYVFFEPSARQFLK